MGKFKNMGSREIFEFTDETTEQELKIKYSKLIKQYKPTEFPDEFQEIRKAYTYLLSLFHADEVFNYIPSIPPVNDSFSLPVNISTAQPSYEFPFPPIDVDLNPSKPELYFKNEFIDYSNLLYTALLMDNEVDNYLWSAVFNQPNQSEAVIDFYIFSHYFFKDDKGITLLKVHCTKKVVDTFKALSVAADQYKQENDVFTELEREYFNSNFTKRSKLLNQLIETSAFSYPFNFIDPIDFNDFKRMHNENFVKYISSLSVKQLLIYRSIQNNKFLYPYLTTQEDQEEFFLNTLMIPKTSRRTMRKYVNYCLENYIVRETTNIKISKIYQMLEEKGKPIDLTSVSDILDALPLIKFIEVFRIRNVLLTDSQEVMLKLLRKTRYSNLLLSFLALLFLLSIFSAIGLLFRFLFANPSSFEIWLFISLPIIFILTLLLTATIFVALLIIKRKPRRKKL